MKGGYTAVKMNELSAATLGSYDSLRMSFDTGTPSNTSKQGQPQNFSLYYSLCGDSEVVQVGETYSGLMSAVKESTFSWTLEMSDYGELFSTGGTFYLVFNSDPLNTTYTFNSLPVACRCCPFSFLANAQQSGCGPAF